MDQDEIIETSEVFTTTSPEEDLAYPENVKVRYDLSVLRSLRRITRLVNIYSHKLSATHQITAPQLTTLITIVNDGPLSQAAISKRIYLSASTLVGILDRLEEKSLIMRQRQSKDRRLVSLSATDKGRELVRQAPSPLPATLSEALQTLPELEQATIALALERIASLLDAENL